MSILLTYFSYLILILELGVPWVTLLSMDSFYRVLNEKEHELANQNKHNFDHPDAFDFELLKETLQRLKEGKKVEVPIYNFVTHRRETKTTSMYGANVLIFEGILAFHDKVTNLGILQIKGLKMGSHTTNAHEVVSKFIIYRMY